MNAKRVLLLSLLLNAALAGVLVWATATRPARSAAAPAAQSAVTDSNATAKAASPAASKTQAVTNTTRLASDQKFDWRMVESEDYRKYIANLRAIGCPEETIRDIIVADVNKLFEARRKELAGPKKKFEFWKPAGLMGAMIEPERMEKERALNKEKRALLVELLGTAPEEKPELIAGAAGQLEAMFDFLPTEKRTKVFEMMQEMQTKMQKAMKGGLPDTEEIRKVMKESEATLAGVLSPEELLDYNLRFSMTANMLRMTLASFEPTEQEFLDVFKFRKAYDDEFGVAGMGMANLKGAEKEKQRAAEKALDGQIKQLLGDSRYDEYKRSQDFNFQAIYRVTERENLGKDAAIRVYDMKKVAEEQAQVLRLDRALTAETRQAALASIRTETERSIRGILGNKAYEAYEGQAWWLKNISPDSKPAGP